MDDKRKRYLESSDQFLLFHAKSAPGRHGFGLGATFVYNFCPFESGGAKQPRWAMKVGYQYNGFNRDQYQHSVTIGGTYRSW